MTARHLTKLILILAFLAAWPGAAMAAEAGSWRHHNDAVIAALKKADFKAAQRNIDTAFALARKEGSESAAYATVLFSRVKFLGAIGKYREVEKPTRQVIVLREKLQGPEHLDLAEPLALLGTLHGTYGRFQAAEALAHRAMAIQQEALGILHPAVADTLENYSIVMLMSGNVGEAARFKQRAAMIRSRIKG